MGLLLEGWLLLASVAAVDGRLEKVDGLSKLNDGREDMLSWLNGGKSGSNSVN